MNLGDCCTLTFLEFGFSMWKDEQKENFQDPSLSQDLEYVYKINEQLLYLRRMKILFCEIVIVIHIALF